MVAHSSYEDLIGTTVGKYRLEKLGEIGAIGPLFIARDSEAGKLYRLRMLIISAALPPEERIEVYHWTLAQMEPEASYAAFEQACNAGYYDRIIAETDEAYERGEVLTSLD